MDRLPRLESGKSRSGVPVWKVLTVDGEVVFMDLASATAHLERLVAAS
jgi:hypothetical protein